MADAITDLIKRIDADIAERKAQRRCHYCGAKGCGLTVGARERGRRLPPTCLDCGWWIQLLRDTPGIGPKRRAILEPVITAPEVRAALVAGEVRLAVELAKARNQLAERRAARGEFKRKD